LNLDRPIPDDRRCNVIGKLEGSQILEIEGYGRIHVAWKRDITIKSSLRSHLAGFLKILLGPVEIGLTIGKMIRL
jgi:hypothetical protein